MVFFLNTGEEEYTLVTDSAGVKEKDFVSIQTMVCMCEKVVWVVLLIVVIVDSSSLVIGSDGINLTRDGQEILELRINMRQESRAYKLEREKKSVNVWLVGEEGVLTKTRKEVKE